MSSSLFITFILLSTATLSQSTSFIVGGHSKSWTTPSPTSPTLNQWAESTRFQIGDSLVWNLEANVDNKDSVLQVTRADYLSCNLSNPISSYRDESTVSVKLDRSGPYYFVSGESGRCEKGEKMAVVVMAERRTTTTMRGRRHYEFFVVDGPAMAPAASSPAAVGGFEEGPAAAPTSGGGRSVVVVVGYLGMLMIVMGLVV